MLSALENGLGLDGDWCMCDTLTSPFLYERRGFACMQRNYYIEIYSGPERTKYDTDLNVLQGKAYKNRADLNTFETSMSLRDQDES